MRTYTYVWHALGRVLFFAPFPRAPKGGPSANGKEKEKFNYRSTDRPETISSPARGLERFNE